MYEKLFSQMGILFKNHGPRRTSLLVTHPTLSLNFIALDFILKMWQYNFDGPILLSYHPHLNLAIALIRNSHVIFIVTKRFFVRKKGQLGIVKQLY